MSESAFQLINDLIKQNRHLIDDPNDYQKEIAALLSKIPESRERIEAISILLQEKFNQLNFFLNEYHRLVLSVQGMRKSKNHRLN